VRDFFERGGDNTKAEVLLRAAVDAYAPLSLQQTLDDARTDGVRKLEWGEMALAIPEQIVALLELMYPDFTSKDRRVRSQAWRAFANSDMGRRFKTQDLRRRY
jgi:hypothetical protein